MGHYLAEGAAYIGVGEGGKCPQISDMRICAPFVSQVAFFLSQEKDKRK